MVNSFCYSFKRNKKKINDSADEDGDAFVDALYSFWEECEDLYENCNNYGFSCNDERTSD